VATMYSKSRRSLAASRLDGDSDVPAPVIPIGLSFPIGYVTEAFLPSLVTVVIHYHSPKAPPLQGRQAMIKDLPNTSSSPLYAHSFPSRQAKDYNIGRGRYQRR
jgi:hypothetical protein